MRGRYKWWYPPLTFLWFNFGAAQFAWQCVRTGKIMGVLVALYIIATMLVLDATVLFVLWWPIRYIINHLT